jgi:1-acyl-sn-glycerol-3-phosphate acyltransferase
MMKLKHLIKTARLVIMAYLLGEAFLICTILFPFLSVKTQKKYVQKWSERVISTFDISAKIVNPHNLHNLDGCLIVANHISWIDVQVIHSVLYCKFISTTEVLSLPVIGRLAKAAGSLFIDLTKPKRSTYLISQDMVNSLRNKETICAFPEATSTDGKGVLAFKSSLFQPAITASAPICPIAIRYLDQNGRLSESLGFYGEMTLLESMIATVRAGPNVAELTVLPLMSANKDKHQLAADCHQLIEEIVKGS